MRRVPEEEIGKVAKRQRRRVQKCKSARDYIKQSKAIHDTMLCKSPFGGYRGLFTCLNKSAARP